MKINLPPAFRLLVPAAASWLLAPGFWILPRPTKNSPKTTVSKSCAA